jgi:hypothetical protein
VGDGGALSAVCGEENEIGEDVRGLLGDGRAAGSSEARCGAGQEEKAMTIQNYPEELDWCNAKLAENRDARSFLVTFCEACLRADVFNYEILRPTVLRLMAKYPAEVKRS